MDIIEKLKQKYDYDDVLIGALEKIIPAMGEYYGQEYKKLIEDAVLSCNIHMQQKITERPEKYLEENLPTRDNGKVLGGAGAFYQSAPVVQPNGDIESKRIIYLRHTCKDLTNNSHLSALVHEMCHLVKSYKDEYVMKDGKLIQRTGISTTCLEKDLDTGKYGETKTEKNGIDEALNTYDEGKIMTIITGEKCYGKAYSEMAVLTDELMEENKTFREAFKTSMLDGDKSYIDKLGEEKVEKISEAYEEICSTYQISFSDINTKEKKEALFVRRDKAKEELTGEVRSITSNKMLDSLRSMVNSDEEIIPLLDGDDNQKDVHRDFPNMERL